MSDNFVTDAINIKSYNLSESDKIIVMYSKDKGLIKGVAKGIKKTKSKLGARMDMFVANTIMLHKGRNLDTICQAEALNTFRKTRNDLDKIFYSMYIAEVINNFGIEGDPYSEKIYNILYKALDAISQAKTKTEILLSVIKFQFKIMLESGFSMELDNCLCCHNQIGNESMYLSLQSGGVICKDCISKIVYPKKQLPYKLRNFFKNMVQNDFDYIGEYETKATERVCSITFELLKDYIALKSPKQFKSSAILQDLPSVEIV